MPTTLRFIVYLPVARHHTELSVIAPDPVAAIATYARYHRLPATVAIMAERAERALGRQDLAGGDEDAAALIASI